MKEETLTRHGMQDTMEETNRRPDKNVQALYKTMTNACKCSNFQLVSIN